MHKYLPEQRLAYVGMAFIILMLILSGLVKTYKNIYAPDMSHTVLLWATWIHNIFFILFFLSFLAHMAAIALRPNWPMVRGIFTGKVRLDYARHRHALWMIELEKVDVVPELKPAESASPAISVAEETAPEKPAPPIQEQEIRSMIEDSAKEENTSPLKHQDE